MKSIHSLFGVAMSAAFLLPTAASHAAVPFANGDLSVSFYQSIGGVVQSNTYVFNLGAGSLYRENTANNVSISTVNPAIVSNNINASLTEAFGSDWATSGTVFWLVAGSVEIFQSPINGDPQLTNYLSAPRASLATGELGKATTFKNISSTNRAIASNNIVPFLQTGTNEGISQSNANVFIPVAGGNPRGVVLPISNNRSLEEYLPPATLGLYFGIGNIPTQVLPVGTLPGGAGVKGALDMYRVIHETTGANLTAGASAGNAVVGQGQFIGTLTLDASGNLKIQGVGAAPVANYATWATANGISGQPASGDFDFDGLTNLVEYALGTDPKVSSQPPGSFSDDTITFTKGADAKANGDVNYFIEESDDLGITDPWEAVVTQNAPNASSTISYMLPSGGPKKFARLKVFQKP